MKSIITFFFLLFLASCQVNVFPPSTAESFANCRDALSQTETLNRMAGRWRLVGTGCGNCVQTGPAKPTKDVTLVFNRNQTFEIYKSGQLFHATTFILNQTSNSNYFTLSHPNKIYLGYVYGIIETCSGKLVFNEGYVDGAIYYYEAY